jgi:glutamate formiminotransferase / formiminotetrahydrofolate cyclodeaminase
MPHPLVECIPNFSEGRRTEVVDAILQALQSKPGAHILDRHSDADHNRTVVTLAGSPEAVAEAMFHAIASAAEHIDMNRQTGVHPRIGATDVVPFVPLRDTTREECILLARQLGRRVGDELGIPVYLYGDAAHPSRPRSLTVLRKGQFEGLQSAILSDPSRKPDFGPSRLGPAGATAVGVRGPLIAFNVYLGTDRVEAACEIARRIRESSGGLPAVQALGMLVRRKAQVSMNLTDFTRTSLLDVVSAVEIEADRLGVQLAGSEIVGLLPAAALQGIDPVRIGLQSGIQEKILETRLTAAGLGEDWPHLSSSDSSG